MTDDRAEADRAAYEETKNPLHVWFAIGRYAADEPLPIWVRRYLLQTSRELLQLQLDTTISPAEAAQRTSRALGLVSKGRNHFATARQLRDDSFIAALYGLAPRKGETEAWATDFAKVKGLRSPRSIRRLVTRVRKIWHR